MNFTVKKMCEITGGGRGGEGGGGLKNGRKSEMGEGRVQNCLKRCEIIFERPLTFMRSKQDLRHMILSF